MTHKDPVFQTTRLYRPSNGSEGDWFMSRFCYQCVKDTPSKPCRIIGRTLGLEVHEKGYPKEWITDEENGPRCTAFADKEKPRPTTINDKRQIGLTL